MKKRAVRLLLVVATLLIYAPFPEASNAQGTSDNFRIDESFIGPGGNLESESDNYRTAPGGQSLGSPGGGETESDNFRTQGGPQTTDDPSLTCSVNTSSLNFGSLSSSATATATATFSVLNYTSYGYIVQVLGDSPGTGSHNLTELSSNASSTIGTEQFGINLVNNATPNIGADPAQVPDNTFSFGEAATNYDTANSFRYVSGETVAQSNESSGRTDYTVSYIVNVANTTPGGSYTGDQTFVCIGTY